MRLEDSDRRLGVGRCIGNASLPVGPTVTGRPGAGLAGAVTVTASVPCDSESSLSLSDPREAQYLRVWGPMFLRVWGPGSISCYSLGRDSKPGARRYRCSLATTYPQSDSEGPRRRPTSEPLGTPRAFGS